MSRKKSIDDNNVCERIKKIRSDLALTGIEFANNVGISQGYLSDIENFKASPNKTLLLAISYIYNIEFDWLLTGEGDRVRKGSVDVLEKNGKNVIELQHNDYVKGFSDKSKIKAINEALLDVERLHPAALDKIETYIKGMVEGLRMASPETRHYDNRFEERRQHDDPTKIPATGDRRLAANDK